MARLDALLQELPFWGEVQPVVQDLAVVECDELITQGTHFAVKDQPFEIQMRASQHRQARGLVAPPGLEADKAVLDDIDAAYAVAAGDRVAGEEEVERIRDSLVLPGFFVEEFDRNSLFEHEREVFGSIGCGFGILCQLPHVCWGSGIGILKNAGFVGAMCKVLIHAPWLAFGAGNRDELLGSVVEQVVAAGEAIVEFGDTPWGNDFDRGLEGVEGELEADWNS